MPAAEAPPPAGASLSGPAVSIVERDLPLGPLGPDAITLRCRCAGSPESPLLLFLHGFPEAAFVWDDLLAHFGSRFHAVAPNLRGYAGSSAPVEVAAYRPRLLVGDLLGVIRQLGGRQAAAVVAHDWGGALAWNLAAQAPDAMQRLVILNAPHPGAFLRELLGNPRQQQASTYMNALCRPGMEERLAEDAYERLFAMLEAMGPAAWLTPALRADYRAAWHKGLTGPLNYYRASPLRPPAGPADPIHAVRFTDAQLRVSVPTRVIWGEGDTALVPELLNGLGDWVAPLEIVRLPDASHWLVHEQPQRVIAEIEAALAAPGRGA